MDPLGTAVVFRIGPVLITEPVVTTWAIIAVFWLLAVLATRRLRLQPRLWQNLLESVVDVAERQIGDILRQDARRFLPLLATLFLYIAAANLSGLLPGVRAPTASIETPAALALIVLLAGHVYGVRARGLRAYLTGYLKPSPLLLPLNILSEITRTFSLMVRLFGNIMSHEIVIAVVVSLAALLVPIPFMALGILIGLIQAYIFTVLAAVYVGAAVGAVERG